MKNKFCWQRAICTFGLIGLMLFTSAGANIRPVSAQTPVPEGETIIVSNAGEELNGNLSSPAALIANPGPDGISLREAMIAAEASAEFDVIRFAPALKGALVSVLAGLPSFERGNVFIDGDIDADGSPDITLDGTGSARDTGFTVYGGSTVMIRGFTVRNFTKHAVSISPDPAHGKPVVSGIIVYQNDLSSEMNAVELTMYQMGNSAIRNVEIMENNLHDSGGGVSVHAGMGDGATNNLVEGVKIISNTINNRINALESHAIFISPASWTGLSNNSIRDIEIRGNDISNYIDTTILIDASNQANCNNNITENIVIADNVVDGKDVTIEVLAESGVNSFGNQVKDMAITGNVITTGGVQFSGATGSNGHDNAISNVLIERNLIHTCMANGIYLSAGTGGAHNNTLEHVTLRSNAVYDCTDAGILLHGESSISPNNTISDVTITNQTLVANGLRSSWSAGGLNINSKDASNTITGVSFTNSILWGNSSGDVIRGALVPAVVAYNILNDARFTGANGNFYQDPLFVNPAAADYHLLAGSPGVDSGEPTGASIGTLDLDAKLRLWDGNGDSSAVVDRGAWELGAPAMQEINVRANGFSILDGDVAPAPWDGTDFGAAELGAAPVEQLFSIENSGALALALSGNPVVAVSGAQAGDFAVLAQPANQVAAGGSVSFKIAFTPLAAGLRQATVSIASNDSDENPYTFAIQGRASTPPLPTPDIELRGNSLPISSGDLQPRVEDGTDFGSTAAGGGMVQHTFSIHNTGYGVLNLTGTTPVSIGGGQSDYFWVVAQPASQVAAGGSVNFTIAFTPQAAGQSQTTVSIASNDADENPYTFKIQGNATAPDIDLRWNGVSIPIGNSTPSPSNGTDFGSTTAGGGSVQHNFAIHNTGDATLNLTGNPVVAISGAQAGDFSIVGQPTAQVAANAWVNFTITFTPQAPGLRQATVSIASNDANENPYTFAIKGSATAPDIELRGNGETISNGDLEPRTKDGTDFGSTTAGGGSVQHNFAIHNTGNAALNLTGNPVVAISGAQAGEFAVDGQPATQVAANAWVNFTVTFTPQAAGLRQATVSIASNDADENPYTFKIQGNATAAPTPEINISANGFSITNGDITPNPTDGTDFGATELDAAPVEQVFTIENSGNAALSLSGNPVVAISGAQAGDFAMLAQPANQVAAGGSVNFTIVFTPQAAGLRQATVSIASNDADENPYTFKIQGTGSATPTPDIELLWNGVPIPGGDFPPSAENGTDFGNTTAGGGTVQHSFAIHNNGNAALNLTGNPVVTISGAQAGDFAVIVQPAAQVAAGGSASFTIAFTPQAAGLRQATVSIASNDADENPYTFKIQGTGTATPMPDIKLLWNGVLIPSGDLPPSAENGTDFGNTTAGGGSVQHNFAIHNNGNAALNLTGNPVVAISGAQAGEFAVLAQPATQVAAKEWVNFTITFTPQAAGLRQATVSIASNDADANPYTFKIQGTGMDTPLLVRLYLPLVLRAGN